ncbi:GntP family permease [Corynebacterium pacaense]|uniref:GntP family permease n=1 Tax=Corynebacterium pacaense TaxID=1816684 RepID=UPI0011774BB3|nr:GntP family permease [Corynebacterium pacaense]
MFTSTASLLLLGIASIAVLLFLIIYFKLNATLSLVAVSALTALVAGTPVGELVPLLIEAFSGTLGKLALIIGFGAVLGRILEQSGGAEVLANGMLRIFGEKRASLALSVACLLFGFPIFFDAGLVVMFPIIFTVARRLGGGVLIYALPAAAAFQVMHGMMPPHPGPVAAAATIGSSVGLIVLLGLLVALPTWYLAGYKFGTWYAGRFNIPVPTILGSEVTERELPGPPPSMWQVLSLLLLPIILITGNTVSSTLQQTGAISTDNAVANVLKMLGETPVALFITVIFALVALGYLRGVKWDNLSAIVDRAFQPVVSIMMVAGAGGMFGGVLRETGVGDALATSLDHLGMPLLVSAYLISLALRVAQGSATVAITTAAGLLGPAIFAAGVSDARVALIIIAMGAGSFFASTVNDSGFWLVGGYLGLDTKTNLKVWTVFTSVISVVAFLLTAVLYLLF